jgi:hypothetical protein
LRKERCRVRADDFTFLSRVGTRTTPGSATAHVARETDFTRRAANARG